MLNQAQVTEDIEDILVICRILQSYNDRLNNIDLRFQIDELRASTGASPFMRPSGLAIDQLDYDEERESQEPIELYEVDVEHEMYVMKSPLPADKPIHIERFADAFNLTPD